jgi:hypothetical protein
VTRQGGWQWELQCRQLFQDAAAALFEGAGIERGSPGLDAAPNVGRLNRVVQRDPEMIKQFGLVREFVPELVPVRGQSSVIDLDEMPEPERLELGQGSILPR